MRKLKLIVTTFLLGLMTIVQVFGQQNNPKSHSLGSKETYLNKLKSSLQTVTGRPSISGIDAEVSNAKTLHLMPVINQTEKLDDFVLIGKVSGYNKADFAIRSSKGQISGQIIIYDTKEAYVYSSDAAGNMIVESKSINDVVCIDYAKNLSAEQLNQLTKPSMDVPYLASTMSLQSLPGAPGCILLDFDGQYVSQTGWASGGDINAAPSGMSDDQVQEVWELISEDYRPFKLNITTSEAVFNSYPQNRRRRCIFTPTNTAAPGAGGVAYISSFNWNNDEPCWEFMTGGAKAPGDAAAHEIGHTLGLGHDGRELPSGHEEYYAPNNGWAPIMGAGYYTNPVQWSKGEYDYANNQQDDIAIIANNNGFGYRDDQQGNDFNSAATLNVNGDGNVVDANNYAVIERTGDVDVFKFGTSTGGTVTLNANTVWRHEDLNLHITIYDANGNQVGNSSHNGFNESWSGNLSSGIYYVAVTGVGNGNVGNGGYSNYGSLGSYTISGFVPNPGISPPASTGLVTVYADINYAGFSGGLSVGDYTLAQLNALGVKDNDITSVKVTEGYKVILYFDNNFTGTQETLTSDANWLGGFNDQITSIQVRPNGVPNMNNLYFIQNRVSGLFLDVNGASTADGAAVMQGGYNGNANQQFQLTDKGDGAYSIIAQHSGKGLDVAAVSYNAGALIQQWSYGAGNKNQQFILFPTGDGFYKLIAEHDGLVVEVSTTNNGEQLHQWWNAGQQNSMWRLVPVDQSGLVTLYTDCNYTGFPTGLNCGSYSLPQLFSKGFNDNTISSAKITEGFKATLYADDNLGGASKVVPANNACMGDFNDVVTSVKVTPNGEVGKNGMFYIQNRLSGMFIDISGASTADGAAAMQGPFNGGTNQQFQFTDLGDGTYSIIAQHSGKGLEVADVSYNSGALIRQWPFGAGNTNQQFILFPTGDGYYKLIAQHDAMVVEVSTTNAGEQLHQWWNAGQQNSMWRLMPVDQRGVVSVYTDCNYGGFKVGLPTGDYTLAQLNTLGFTDNSLSSMKVPEGFQVILYADDNFTGKQVTITNDVVCYSPDWDNTVTSIRALPNGDPTLAGTYFMKNNASGLSVDLQNGTLTNGTPIRQWTYNGSDAQKYTLVHLGNGNYNVVQVASNKVLDVSGVSYVAGANVIQWDNANGKNQHFIMVDAGNGLFKMIAEHTGMAIDVATTNVGEALRQFTNTNQDNSKWLFIPTNQTIGTGNGLTGNYFNGQNFETPVFTRIDATIDMNWGNGSPNASVNNDSFSARWTGQIQAKQTGEYTFYINSDNGRKLWVNNQLVIDQWVDDCCKEYTGKITLTAGQKYDFKLDYFEDLGGAEAHLYWSTLLLPKEIVPSTQLFANALPSLTLASPANNSIIKSTASVIFTANASDSDGTVARVEFYNGTQLINTSTIAPYTFNWGKAAPGVYNVSARAYDNMGAVTVTTINKVTVDDVTGIETIDASEKVFLYPNPTSSILNIKSSFTEMNYEVFDVMGQEVLAGILKDNQLNVAQLASGIYYIKLFNENEAVVRKFIKE